ncbi:M50 family metallopeptidase [Candidatus Woesearchaeota archaeon]|nr:M50 family metallopeptidase [Candidatus Woesearchaeota archaeon]
MAIISIQEIIDIIIMTVAVGFIFKDVFRKHNLEKFDKNYDPLDKYMDTTGNKEAVVKGTKQFLQSPFFIACLATAPAIIVHELAHKFVALGFGIQATFHASYFWLLIGVVLKLLNFGFIFFVPGYVSHIAASSPLIDAAIAFAGPFLNLVLWIGVLLVLKMATVKGKWLLVLEYTKYINMFLFFFNMIPIGPFDGASVFRGLFAAFFG